MLLPSTLELLRDILREVDLLQGEARRTTREVFLGNEVLKRPFVRSLEIVGEAAKQVPEDVRQRFPGVEWRKRCRGPRGQTLQQIWPELKNWN